jgi:SAM-dependent methyltransferase
VGTETFLIQELHTSTARSYLERMMDNKVEAMEKAREYAMDYWDGDRRYGYGGYKYMEGRWKPFAEKLIQRYKLSNNSSLLDLGCGKGYLLYEIQKILPGIELYGVDISKYALENIHPQLKMKGDLKSAADPLPFTENQFDLVISVNTLHNLKLQDFEKAIANMMKYGKNQYLVVEGFRDSQEQFNLECWALTANLLLSREDWIWLFRRLNYNGDFEFIYFE